MENRIINLAWYVVVLVKEYESNIFKQKVDDFKVSKKFLKNWQWVDKNIAKEKVISKVSTLLH